MGDEHLDTSPQAGRGRRKLLGWGLVALGAIERLLDWIGNVDLVVTRTTEPGWIGSAVTGIGSYSPIWGTASLILGFYLIIRGERRYSDQRYLGREQLVEELDSYLGRQIPNKLNAGELVVESDAPSETVVPRSALYCYAPSISLSGLAENCRFEIAIIAFNGYEHGARFRRVAGYVIARGKDREQRDTELQLQTPSVIAGRCPETYEPRSEFMVVLTQAVTPGEAHALDAILTNGTATFDMRELRLEIDLDDDAQRSERLPISRSPNARRTSSGGLIYNHTVFMSIGLAID